MLIWNAWGRKKEFDGLYLMEICDVQVMRPHHDGIGVKIAMQYFLLNDFVQEGSRTVRLGICLDRFLRVLL